MDFKETLKAWYKENKRDLPWRRTTDPYKIWLSEVILQQTRVDQGLAYYERFIEAYPTVFDLADADEKEVLKMWQGLGYYSRARNLHETAKRIAQDFNGKFPNRYKAIMDLKGVGPYTAAAIGSFCFGISEPVVDGNVERVTSRFFGVEEPVNTTDGKKRIRDLVEGIFDHKEPGTFNQAIMEFGATQCTPRDPDCGGCPFHKECIAFKKGWVTRLPVKKRGKKVKHRYFNYLYLRYREDTFLERRSGKDIWQGLYQFPLIETTASVDKKTLVDQVSRELGIQKAKLVEVSDEFQHTLSHQRIHAHFWEFELEDPPQNVGLVRTTRANIHEYAVPRLMEKFLEKKLQY